MRTIDLLGNINTKEDHTPAPGIIDRKEDHRPAQGSSTQKRTTSLPILTKK